MDELDADISIEVGIDASSDNEIEDDLNWEPINPELERKSYLEQIDRDISDSLPISSPGKYVCSECVFDPHMKQRIETRGHEGIICSYCVSSVNRTTSFDHMAKHMHSCIWREWSTGGYFFDDISTLELFKNHLDIGGMNSELLKDLISAFGQRDWSGKSWGPDSSEFNILRWHRFIEAVKYRTRYVFFRKRVANDASSSDIKMAANARSDELFIMLSEMINAIHGTKRRIGRTKAIYRARMHMNNTLLTTAEQLGPPTKEIHRKSNRMSPAGIPMFYGAFDLDTAVDEVKQRDTSHNACSIGEFHSVGSMNLLDLSKLPTPVTIFGYYICPSADVRNELLFLHDFVQSISKSVDLDGFEHIEYVPSQVFTEFIRDIFTFSSGAVCDGIIYPSSIHRSGECLVLFINHDEVADGKLTDIGNDADEDYNRHQQEQDPRADVEYDLRPRLMLTSTIHRAFPNLMCVGDSLPS